MSVTAVVAELRRAQALLATALAATMRADHAITDGAAVFGSVTKGSTRPEVHYAQGQADAAITRIQAASAGIRAAHDLIDVYCRSLTGSGSARDVGASYPLGGVDAVASAVSRRSQADYATWIDELKRNGNQN